MKKIFNSIIISLVLVLSALSVSAARLPTVGSDANNWGTVLNDYLSVAHDENGTLKEVWNLANFTNAYDARADRYGNSNFTNQLSVASINSNQVNGLGTFAVLNDIPDNNVTTSKIADNAVTDAKVVDTITASNYLPLAGGTLSGNLLINGARINNITGEEQFLSVSGSLTGVGDVNNNAKTWVIKASATRPLGSNTINGDFDDALFKGSITNKATGNEANYIMRGLNIGATNRDGGNVNKLHGAHISATQKGSSAVVTDLWGLSVKVEADSPNTAPTNVVGANIEYDMVAPTGTPTISAGVRVNQNSDAAFYPKAGLMIDNGAAGRYWQYGLYINDGTIQKADLRLSSGQEVYTGSATTRNAVRTQVGTQGAIGSLYLSSAGKMYLKVANADADADWNLVTTTATD